MSHASLVDVLRHHAATRPDRRAVTFVIPGDGGETTWTFAQLHDEAARVAAALQQRTTPGDRVLLLYPQGLDYVAALFGCMMAGVLAVPLQPPGRHRAKHALPKLEAIVADGPVALSCTITGDLADMKAVVDQSEALRAIPWLATDALDTAPDDVAPVVLDADTLAYLQYTSGSTSTPKGVMVSHGNLLYNLFDFDFQYGHDDESVMVSWLPTFHDLGLVYGVFLPLYKGFEAVILDPLDFLRRPMRWLEAIHRHRGTHAPAPNFAFDLCAAKSKPAERAALDLSCWKVALNGAEPIRYESEARFVEAFGAAGVTWTTLSHAYGMSETTAVIAKEPVGTEPVFLDVDGEQLDAFRVVPVAADHPAARRVAGCGVTTNQTRVVIAEPDTLEALPGDRVGEIWVGGPTRAQGYWNRPEATEEGFRARTSNTGEGPFLRTGDLGFVHDGQVYVAGRLKDMVILRGENHYPQDLEWSVQGAHPAIRPSCVAAFSVPHGGVEGLALVMEVYPDRAEPEAVFAAVRDALSDHGVAPVDVALIAPSQIFKTSSGKIMRRRTRQALLAGEFALVSRWTAEVREPAPTAAPAVDLRARLDAAAPYARPGLLVAHVQALAAELLGFDDPTIVDPDQPVRELGFDSVQAVELADRLSQDLGWELPTTVLFDHPTATALAAWVLSEEAATASTAGPSADATPAAAASPEVAEDDLEAALLAELEGLD